jgi:hypothetical protein
MKKNIILIVALILFCCGCTAEYTLSIDENLNVTEQVTILEGEEFYQQYEKSSVQRVIGFILNPNLEYLNNNGFVVTNLLGKEEAGVLIENTYDSIAKYKEVSEFPKQYAENWEFITNGDEITFKIIGEFNDSEQDQNDRYLIDNGKISIKLPHDVINHNADEVNEKDGIYTWIIEKAGEEREIFITFNKVIKKDYTVLYIVIGGIIVLAGGCFYFISKTIRSNKNRNEL